MKTLFALASLLISTNAFALLEDLKIDGPVTVYANEKPVKKTYCAPVEKKAKGEELSEFKKGHEAELRGQKLTPIGTVFVCPIAGTSGRMNEFIYFGKTQEGKDLVFLSNPFRSQSFEIISHDANVISATDKNGLKIDFDLTSGQQETN